MSLDGGNGFVAVQSRGSHQTAAGEKLGGGTFVGEYYHQLNVLDQTNRNVIADGFHDILPSSTSSSSG